MRAVFRLSLNYDISLYIGIHIGERCIHGQDNLAALVWENEPIESPSTTTFWQNSVSHSECYKSIDGKKNEPYFLCRSW